MKAGASQTVWPPLTATTAMIVADYAPLNHLQKRKKATVKITVHAKPFFKVSAKEGGLSDIGNGLSRHRPGV